MKRFLIVFILVPFLSSAQTNHTLISNTNVIDVATGKVIKEASVLFKDGVIQDVFTNKKYKLPPNSTVIDGTGKYVMPGMTDAHIHFCQTGGLYTRPDGYDFNHIKPYAKEREDAFNSAGDFMRRYLKAGITTVADVGGPFNNFIIRDSLSKQQLSPTVLVTGPLFSMVADKPLDNGDPPIVKTTSIAAADSLMDRLLARKPDYIKIWYIVRPDLPADKTFPVVQHIAKRTHDAKLKLAVHATQHKTAELAVDAGADLLVHSVDDEVISDVLLKKLVMNKVSYNPTFIVNRGDDGVLLGEFKPDANDVNYANPFFYGTLMDPEHIPAEDLPKVFANVRSRRDAFVKRGRTQDSIMRINLKRVYDAGVNVVAGTDAGNPGTMHASSFVRELEAMKSAGLTNANLLKTATLNSANCFGMNTGVVAKGKVADIIILSKNPLDDISVATAPEYVIKSGKILKTDTLVIESPEMLVQRQLNAYNARNIDAFLDTYSDDIEIYNFPDKLMSKGKDAMRKRYGEMFGSLKRLHCKIVDRIVLNNTVIDHEYVNMDDNVVQAIAIYDVKDGKIVKVSFKR